MLMYYIIFEYERKEIEIINFDEEYYELEFDGDVKSEYAIYNVVKDIARRKIHFDNYGTPYCESPDTGDKHALARKYVNM